MSIEKVKQLQREMQSAKDQAGILKGKISVLTDQLKQYGYSDTKQAAKKIKFIKKELKKEKEQFKKLLRKLEKTFFLKEG